MSIGWPKPFAALIAGLLLAAFALMVAVPYYFMTKPAQLTPESSIGLDRLKEP